ncbi:rod shape-determining protein RodA [Candidatus Uhrbacteria bacterium]|jgi:rod shape determining protein RodA|nr:rod shape-determining protein RodA [Candidatus Uhrbacteria bacterium]
MIASRFFREFQRFDWLLLLATFVLFAFGLAAIYSVELSRETLEFALVKKHAAIFLVSTVVMIVIANFNHLFLRSWGRALYLVGVALMVLVLFFGTELNGTTGWFIVAGVSFQPVEFMKVALAVQLARYFGEHARRRFGWKEIFGSGFLVAAPTVLTIAQPDLGSAILLIGMWMIVMFFAGLRVHHAVIITFAGALLGWVAWMFALADYQRLRLQVFLDPTLDPLGSGYNIAQAKIAIGSGQLFGRGLGFGSQSQLQFLPESQTDFIFAVIAEELGFIGVMVVFAAIGVLLWRMLTAARQARDNFTSFLAIGIFAIFVVQSVVNIGVNLAVLPTTGVALPLVSAGGTSLLISMILIGIVQSIVVHLRPGDKINLV